MKDLTGTKHISLESMKKYLSEWFIKIEDGIEEIPDSPDKELYVIRDANSMSLEFLHILNKGTFDKNMIVSTEGILGIELRGLIEQCITLDEMSASYNKSNVASSIQKQ